MNKLGVFFTCFNEVEATHFSLNMLRRNYPDAPVCLFNESNEDYDFLYKYFKNIEINNVDDTMTDTLQVTVSNFRDSSSQKAMLVGVNAILERLEHAITFCQSEYIIMLDPDAVIRGKLNIPDGSGLLGCRQNSNPLLLSEMNKILEEHGGIPMTAWGATPAIFNVEKFQKGKSILLKDPELLPKLTNSFYAVFAHDILMGIIFSLIKEKEEFNPDLVQISSNPNWLSSRQPLLHQFRFFYPPRKTKYEIGNW